MNFYIHIALDAFGAEALGRACSWLRLAADREREHHLYVWAGVGEPPANNDYWADQYPVWDDRIAAPSVPGAGFDVDRRSLAASVHASLLGDECVHKFRELTHDWPDRLLGRDHAAKPALVYCVSLLDPAGSALLLGHLAALADRRKIGSLLYRAHVVAGMGVASGPSAEREEQARALGARTLMDLEDLFKSRALPDVATPVYLVGEQPIEGAESDRVAQTALAGMGVVALTRGTDNDAVNPFEFFLDGAGQAQWAGAPYDADQPFAAIGGFTVWCPADRLARLFSARLATICFDALASQPSCGSLELAAKIDDLPPGIMALVARLETETVRRLWEQVVEPEHIPWDPKTMAPPSGCFDLERVRALYGTIFGDKEWQRIMGVYGEPRLRDIPLDSWESAFDDLEELVEHGVLPRRKQRIDLITRRILQAFLRSVETGISEIFAHAFRDPVHTLPHRCAQAYLGRLRRSLEAKSEEVEREAAHDRAVQADPADMRKSAVELRNELRRALEAVPSPLAVFLRVAPLFVLGEALFCVLPFDLGWLNPASMRLVAGAVTGAAAGLALFIRQVESIRARLLGGATQWLKQYQGALDLEDELLRNASYRGLLDSMLACLDWLYDGKEDEPPLPHIFEPKLRNMRGMHPGTAPPDQLPPQEPLSRFEHYLTVTADRYRELERRFLADFQSSRLEAALPDLSVRHSEAVRKEFSSLVGVASEQDAVPAALQMIEQMAQWLGLNRTGRAWMMPFTGGPSETPLLWRRSFLMPTGEELVKADVRSASSGFQFFATLQEHLEERFANCFDLAQRITEYVTQEGQAVALTDLYLRYTGRATPSVPVDGGVLPHVSAAAPSDPLALNLRCSNSQGHGLLSMHLQVSEHVAGAQAIFYPNEREPLSPIGRAWKTHQATPFSGTALIAVDKISPEASA